MQEIKQVPRASIRSLSLNNCNIRTLVPNAFANIAETLEDINLSNNNITTIPQFGNLPKLISLELNNNKLTDIPENCFNGTTSLRSLKVKANKICNLSRITLNEVKEKLETLDLSHNCFERIPAQNLRNSLSLQYLDLSGNLISEIANFELMNLPQLLELNIRDNRLEKISQMAFMNVPNLQYIYLSNNLLSIIESPRIFQVFKQLQVLDLSENKLGKRLLIKNQRKSSFLQIPIIKDLPNIREIRGDKNYFQRIDTLTFSANPKLQLISLQNNNISSIAKNSFDALEQLSVLLLNNNYLTAIERGMLDGMKNLQELNLRHNSLVHIGDRAFVSVPGLTVLDLSNNLLANLSEAVFDPLKHLFLLDLSYNRLNGFKPGTFKNRIAQLIFHVMLSQCSDRHFLGNDLMCDNSTNWLVDYLVLNDVRIFLPFQPEIICSHSGYHPGVRLKELLIKKANDTVNAQSERNQSPLNEQQNFLYGLLPNSMINRLSKNSLPLGLNMNLPSNSGQQYAPLSNGYTSEELSNINNIDAVVKAMSDTTVSVPGIGNVDLSKVPPSIISYVLRGGQIPGIPKKTLDQLVRMYTTKLNSISNLTPTAVANAANTNADYQETTNAENQARNSPTDLNTTDVNELANVIQLPPQLLQLLKLLPPNYDLAKIPNEVIQAVSRNELPDFGLLPADLQKHLITNIHNVITTFVDEKNVTIDDIIKKLPKLERPIAPTFPPYSIDEVRNDLVHTEQKTQQQRRIQLYTGVLLSFVSLISIIVVVMLCVYTKRKRQAELERCMEEDSLVNTLQYPAKLMTPTPPTTQLPIYSTVTNPYSTYTYSRQPRPMS
uniref:LRRCT domain-containing protein n=1 Tax=Syphacia muris TaxID=451379 RepID=A0A0N5ATT8_9BILA